MKAIKSVVKMCGAVLAMALFSMALLPGVASAEPVTLISVEGTTGDENDTFIDARVRLSNPVDTVTTVRFATSPDTAKSGQDFYGKYQIVTLQPGQTIVPVSVWLINDTVPEDTELFNVRIWDVQSGSNVVTGSTHAKMAIRDDDRGTEDPFANVAGTTINEGADFVDVRIRLSNISDEVVVVNFATAPNTARSGQDFYGTYQRIEFQPHQTVAVARIDLIDDYVAEPTENFKVRIWEGENVKIGINQAFVTINDND